MHESPPAVEIEALDHFVLTVANIERTVAFFSAVLGMRPITFAGGRHALEFGLCKINLHEVGSEFLPGAARPVPGSADVCFVTATPTSDVVARLEAHGVRIEEGIGRRNGARGPMTSVYIRDPDGNLIEIATYATGSAADTDVVAPEGRRQAAL